MAPEVVVRPWECRRDRSAIERWPAADLPAHWSQVEYSAGKRESWAIDRAGELVGRITLRDFSPLGHSATLGIYLRPDCYGQGIGTAALVQFYRLSPVLFLVVEVAVDNARAWRCYSKAGFVELHTAGGFTTLGRHISASDRTPSERAVCGPVH